MWSILAIVALAIWLAAIPSEHNEQLHQVTASEDVRNPWTSRRAWVILLYFGLQTSLFLNHVMAYTAIAG